MGWDRCAVRFQAEDLLPVLFPGVERLSLRVVQGEGSGYIFGTISSFKTGQTKTVGRGHLSGRFRIDVGNRPPLLHYYRLHLCRIVKLGFIIQGRQLLCETPLVGFVKNSSGKQVVVDVVEIDFLMRFLQLLETFRVLVEENAESVGGRLLFLLRGV